MENAALLNRLRSVLGPRGLLGEGEIGERYRAEGGLLPTTVLRPETTEEVQAVLAACHEARAPLVVQGGLTGFGGSTGPLTGEIALSMERMQRIEAPDTDAATILAEAGAPLQRVQEAAEGADLFFGVDIGARGSCTIGGNIATNAGGNRVLRYGMFRAQVLGLEAVLADGTVLSSLSGLMKDNAGYDLKQLFIGSEGTLGIVTKARLRLHPKPRAQVAALGAVDGLEQAIALLRGLRAALGSLLSAYEIIWGDLYDAVHGASVGSAPLPAGAPLYVLLEIQGSDPLQDPERFEHTLMALCEDGLLTDAVISRSVREFSAIWAVREACSHHIGRLADVYGFDVSADLKRIGGFLDSVHTGVAARDPATRLFVFGHLGDGNLHVIAQTREPDPIKDVIYGCVAQAGGSISAEHGIGLEKKPYLHLSRSPAEIEVMRRVKRALDPHQILNPGRIFDMPARGAC
jgi:FAD/FMN-containing dehydrogenase